MNYALDQFTLTDGKLFVVQGANSLYTYQNLGTNVAQLQGSNDSIQWTEIAELQPASSLIKEHSYKYLRCLGQTTVSVNRGEGNNTNDDQLPPITGGTGSMAPIQDLNVSDPTRLEVKNSYLFNLNPGYQRISGTSRKGVMRMRSFSQKMNQFELIGDNDEQEFILTGDQYSPQTIQTRYDLDPSINEVVAEFLLEKDYIYYIGSGNSNGGMHLGNATSFEFTVYAGADNDKNYFRFAINQLDGSASIFLCKEDGIEQQIPLNTSSMQGNGGIIGFDLKTRLSYAVMDQVKAFTMYEDSFTKLLDFTDTAPKLRAKIAWKKTSTDSAFNSESFSLSKTKEYINLTPMRIKVASGSATFKFEKQKSAFFFMPASSYDITHFCTNPQEITNNSNMGAALAFGMTYDAVTDSYTYQTMSSGQQHSGAFTVGPDDEIELDISISGGFITLAFKDFSTSIPWTYQYFFILDFTMVMAAEQGTLINYDFIDLDYDLSLMSEGSTIKIDSFKDGERFRIVGGSIDYNNTRLLEGDVIEFFNNLKDIVIIRLPPVKLDLEKIPLTVIKNGYETRELIAYYDPALKALLLGGTTYYSGSGQQNLFSIDIQQLQTKLGNVSINVQQVGLITDTTMSPDFPARLSPEINQNLISFVNYNFSGNYSYGNLYLPLSVFGVING